MWQHVDRGTPNPQLERIFDYYLRMVWQLSLAIPAPYVLGNPFDLLLQDKLYLFEMPQSGRATPGVRLERSEPAFMKVRAHGVLVVRPNRDRTPDGWLLHGHHH